MNNSKKFYYHFWNVFIPFGMLGQDEKGQMLVVYSTRNFIGDNADEYVKGRNYLYAFKFITYKTCQIQLGKS